MIFNFLVLDDSGTLLTDRPMGFGAPLPAERTVITIDGMHRRVERIKIDYDTTPMRVTVITSQM
jgi:hypothetical protein